MGASFLSSNTIEYSACAQRISSSRSGLVPGTWAKVAEDGPWRGSDSLRQHPITIGHSDQIAHVTLVKGGGIHAIHREERQEQC